MCVEHKQSLGSRVGALSDLQCVCQWVLRVCDLTCHTYIHQFNNKLPRCHSLFKADGCAYIIRDAQRC